MSESEIGSWKPRWYRGCVRLERRVRRLLRAANGAEWPEREAKNTAAQDVLCDMAYRMRRGIVATFAQMNAYAAETREIADRALAMAEQAMAKVEQAKADFEAAKERYEAKAIEWAKDKVLEIAKQVVERIREEHSAEVARIQAEHTAMIGRLVVGYEAQIEELRAEYEAGRDPFEMDEPENEKG